ncbi:type VII secretion protein EccE [Mycobacterium aquaticum]|uniref:Type VII secretion protein EccE n=1 Tax=Mycobacterium aquaticum TaxID=1927124 RepID=A0A1X0B2A0_9MYCO|nr:type VII secretion protein EccE [Mycobacterium aquaticum]ORA36228.1 type VII secretion protein EccE [Mycobacterium aquaticum]
MPPNPFATSTRILPHRILPLAELILLEVVLVLGVAVYLWTGWPWWACAGMCISVMLLLTVRRHGTGLMAAVTARWAYRRGRGRRSAYVDVPEAFDYPGTDDVAYGFRWDGRTVITVIGIEDNPEDLTVLEPGSTVSGEMVRLGVPVDCLRQFDVELDSVDVISHGSRSQGHTPVAHVYDAVLGPLPAIAHRSVWVVVRFDPTRCPQAVGLRGGGQSGILRTAAVATRRVANRLTECGLRARVLTASEIGQAVGQLCGGANLANLHEDWQHCSDGNFRMTSFGLSRDMLTTQALGELWTVPSYATTVAISLRNISPERVGITGTVRFDSFGPLPRIGIAALSALPGRQFLALMSSLPMPRPERDITECIFGGSSADFDGLDIPAAGCGQVIGADRAGRAVALPLFGPRIGRVEIRGSLHLAQQVVLRALALGARILVRTSRSGQWREMVGNVDDNRLLWVTDFNRGSLQAGADRNYTLEAFDGVVESGVRSGVTAMVVVAPTEPATILPAGTDVLLEELQDDSDRVMVRTRSAATVVSMVATADELRYIGRSLQTR